MSEIEKEMAEAVLEAIDLRLKPIKDGLEAVQGSVEALRKDLAMQKAVMNKNADIDTQNKALLEKKFVVTARLFESIVDGLEKVTNLRKCDDDVKGIKLLKGEPY